jgi:hypothetical protein
MIKVIFGLLQGRQDLTGLNLTGIPKIKLVNSGLKTTEKTQMD